VSGAHARSLTLYTRAGCPLCVEMAGCVRDRLGTHRLITLDVDADAALQARFGRDVPLLYDGETEICRHEFDAVAFARWQGEG
jgi:hypothetical protein